MRVINIGSNMTEADTGSAIVLVSYSTPVAARMPNGAYIRTAKKWSSTTTRHINKWLAGVRAVEVEQRFLNELLERG